MGVQSCNSDLRVLYPGCHRHLTASLYFPLVVYVDCDAKVADTFSSDTQAVDYYVQESKVCDRDHRHDFKFFCSDYTTLDSIVEIASPKNPFDLLLSMSAGQVQGSCSKYVKRGGHLLVSDAHADARAAFVARDVDGKKVWKLIAVYNSDRKVFDDSAPTVKKCFLVEPRKGKGHSEESKPSLITPEQVEESIKVGSVSKRSFKMAFEPMFYLFQKL